MSAAASRNSEMFEKPDLQDDFSLVYNKSRYKEIKVTANEVNSNETGLPVGSQAARWFDCKGRLL